MTGVTIRPVDRSEWLQDVYPLTSYALHPSAQLTAPEEWKERVTSRQGVTWLAVEI